MYKVRKKSILIEEEIIELIKCENEKAADSDLSKVILKVKKNGSIKISKKY